MLPGAFCPPCLSISCYNVVAFVLTFTKHTFIQPNSAPFFSLKHFQRVVFQMNCTGAPIQVSCSRKFRDILQQISWSGSVQTLLLCPWKAGFLSGLSDGSRWFLAMFRTTAINFICLWFGFVKLSSLLYWCYHVVIFSLVVKIKQIAPDYN